MDMEIHRQEITLDDRIKYIEQITANQKLNKGNFSWTAAFFFLLVGACIGAWLSSYLNKREEKKNKEILGPLFPKLEAFK